MFFVVVVVFPKRGNVIISPERVQTIKNSGIIHELLDVIKIVEFQLSDKNVKFSVKSV